MCCGRSPKLSGNESCWHQIFAQNCGGRNKKLLCCQCEISSLAVDKDFSHAGSFAVRFCACRTGNVRLAGLATGPKLDYASKHYNYINYT